MKTIKLTSASLHTQLVGMAHYDQQGFMFCPDEACPGQVADYRLAGVAQLLRDGTFSFTLKPRVRAKSTLIKKLAHGRVSHTKDGAVQLTLKVYAAEGLNIGDTLAREAIQAKDAVVEQQLRR
jgi:hypothetical protein